MSYFPFVKSIESLKSYREKSSKEFVFVLGNTSNDNEDMPGFPIQI